MPYTSTTADDEHAMLKAIGVESIEELFEPIPGELRLREELKIPPAMGELELMQHMTELASRNSHTGQKVCFLGGGSYDHFIPSVVDAIASRGEFYTSYTPYQAEVSQGNLQVMFEYQTLICQISGMDVSNASLYDGGSAIAEAVLMSISATRRHGKVISATTVHPEYRQIVRTYTKNLGVQFVEIDSPHGRIHADQVAAELDAETACVLVQHPNFFGNLEEVKALSSLTQAAGALLIVSFDPISVGLLKSPGALGADIAVAEGQSLGTPLQFGGPYLGIMATREKFMRRMPGRIAGQTVDRRDRRCWVLTLQTREQHIRREKATSNICTNQGLFALRSSVYLSAMGRRGLQEAAELSLRKAHYAADRLTCNNRFSIEFDVPFFKEFVVRDRRSNVPQLIADAADEGFFAGVPLGSWYPDLQDCLLVAVTEKRTKREIDDLVSLLSRM